jgi:nucleoside-diphosphate-sugar epimerase
VPKNIYGVTKVAAEDLCQLAHRNQGLACLVLRTSRFFPDADDDPARREAFSDANLKVNEFLYRRLDLEDVVTAHLCALERAPALGFGRYIVSAATPLRREDAEALRRDAPAVVRRRVAGWEAAYAELGWQMAPSIDRVYDSSRARAELGWQPRHDFASVLARARATGDYRSPLAREVGVKGYHPEGIYPFLPARPAG